MTARPSIPVMRKTDFTGRQTRYGKKSNIIPISINETGSKLLALGTLRFLYIGLYIVSFNDKNYV